MRSKSLSFTSKTVRRQPEPAQAAIGETRTGRSGENHPERAGGHPERRKSQSSKLSGMGKHARAAGGKSKRNFEGVGGRTPLERYLLFF
jgi:hypothetical protein